MNTNENWRKSRKNEGKKYSRCKVRDMTKFSEIELMLTSDRNKSLSILSLCETKLNDNKPTSAFHINGFHTPFRKDNHTNAGGGILVYVRNTILAKRRLDLETNEISCLWLEIIPEKGKSFLVGSLYRNPNERVEWVDRFEKFIDVVLNEGKEIILLGDFNKDLSDADANREWLILTESLGLTQLVTEPTRVTAVSSTLIDHIYTNEDEHVSSTHVAHIQISDHYAIFCNRRISPVFKKDSHKSISYRSFKHFNDDMFLYDLMCVNWTDIESINDIDSMINTWYSMFTEVVDKHAPVKTQRVKRNIQPDWLTSEILDSMRERDKCKKSGNLELYKTLRNKISSLIKESKEATYKSKIDAGKNDPKSIWKIFKEFGASSKKNNNDKILGLNIDNEIVTDESVLAETFNDYFVNIASELKEPMTKPDFAKLREFVSMKIPENVTFDLPDVDENFVFKFLSTLDVSKSTGLDGIGPRLLKLSSGVIYKSLTFIVKKCIENGFFPLLWKQAKVTPLYKNGSRDEINNYRPISILPTLSKLIEKFIQKNLVSFLNQ